MPPPHDPPAPRSDDDGADFARAADEKPPGLVWDFVAFLRENKKWWLVPILVVLLLIGVLVALGSTALGPFLYPLF